MPSGLAFFLGCFVLLELVATAYVCVDPRLFLRTDDLKNDASSTPLEAAARRQRIVREESPDPNPFWARILLLMQINQRSDACQPLHNHHQKKNIVLQNMQNQNMNLVLSTDAKPRLKWTPEASSAVRRGCQPARKGRQGHTKEFDEDDGNS
ncbi:hypothetical protein TB1_043675 [Malus domestica]